MKNYPLPFLFFLLISTQAGGEVFKWVDENGVTHYSDTPAEQVSKQLSIAPSASVPNENTSGQDREERRRRLAETLEEDRLLKKQEKEKQLQARADQQQQKQRCQYAQDHLRRMEEAGAVYDLDKDGNRVFQSDEQRQATIAKHQAQIAKYCK